MGYTVPTSEPSALRAGDSWAWRREDLAADWPASTWTFTYRFRNAAGGFDLAASADGDAFAVAVSAADSADYTAGWYDWWLFASATIDGTAERYEIGRGRCEVLPDLDTAVGGATPTPPTAYDGRHWARRLLDYVEATLEGRASTDQLDLVNAQLADRQLQRNEGGLLALRSQLLVEVERAESASGFSRNRRLVVRFGTGA